MDDEHTKRRDKARTLRKDQSEPERRLWSRLRNRSVEGAKFRRQQPLGPFVLDFYCLELNLAIEVDGSQHFEAYAEHYDEGRNAFLVARGVHILRLT